MELVLLYLGLCLAVGVFAHVSRDRSGLGWFLLALAVSPLIAAIWIAILKPLAPREPVPFDQFRAAEQERLARIQANLQQHSGR
ncbi:hypothetical protein [Bradyrhizobium zhanjiangense]|uniref:Uncharacterized protein n=1 Tax=Bradyrhizobium zhanjiangense TaxID=1325107 RepID=A0A4Q0RZL8_9BRAD|nr:hypothetical protein [Bradyrhizobium zhanjiangense]RXG97034.1 hypothetical protein EAS62_10125 [Bradyrhizobium zhanjiangense]RXH25102.1 hypothetical protein XH94_35800 [Bradyrhizobium zhanjiangense]